MFHWLCGCHFFDLVFSTVHIGTTAVELCTVRLSVHRLDLSILSTNWWTVDEIALFIAIFLEGITISNLMRIRNPQKQRRKTDHVFISYPLFNELITMVHHLLSRSNIINDKWAMFNSYVNEWAFSMVVSWVMGVPPVMIVMIHFKRDFP